MHFLRNIFIILVVVLIGSIVVFSFPLKTSVITFFQHIKTPTPEVKLLVVGDMFFDRYIRQVGDAKGPEFIFSCINPLLKSVDLVVGNLEGPITQNPSISQGTEVGTPENFTFTFPVRTAKLLREHNIPVVSIGNNHIGNFGLSGIVSTKKYLDEAEVNYFGGLVGDNPVHRREVKGVPFSFVSYNQFGGDSSNKVAQSIKEEHDAGRTVIVYAHWGEEYIDYSAQLRPTAELFVRSGAAVIVGTHSHVIGSHEYIDGVPVYYSLGNFIFDQYWNEKVKTGLALSLRIKEGKASVEEHLVTMKTNGQTCPSK